MKVLVTGAAGFIGMHSAKYLLERGDEVVGLDNLNPYYDVSLKRARLCELSVYSNFTFVEGDISHSKVVADAIGAQDTTHVLHLAAQAGIRYSLEHPELYGQSNLLGFLNMLEACRQSDIEHLVYASSSSVYGANKKLPFSENDNVDQPVSLYAATKKSNELMAYSYSHLFNIPTTGLRYFTVYGPWGRPDMSPWLFTSAIMENRDIKIFNNGKMQRDFTYVDDIVEGSIRALDKPPTIGNDDSESANTAPYRLYNIGSHQPVELMSFIETLESVIGKSAQKRFLPMQAGDVVATFADTSRLQLDTGFQPSTSLDAGIKEWVSWYRQYHQA